MNNRLERIRQMKVTQKLKPLRMALIAMLGVLLPLSVAYGYTSSKFNVLFMVRGTDHEKNFELEEAPFPTE